VSIALTKRVQALEQAANAPHGGVMDRVAALEAKLEAVVAAHLYISEKCKTLEGQYRALNARVGKALKKSDG
jgi:hypothetical protein